MNSMSNLSAHASVGPATDSPAVDTSTPEPTFTLTASELRDMMSEVVARVLASQGAASALVQVSDPGARGPVAMADGRATRILGLVEQAASRVTATTRDRIVARTTNFLVRKAGPQGLSVIAAGSTIAASGARMASDVLARVADSLAAKSATLTRR